MPNSFEGGVCFTANNNHISFSISMHNPRFFIIFIIHCLFIYFILLLCYFILLLYYLKIRYLFFSSSQNHLHASALVEWYSIQQFSFSGKVAVYDGRTLINSIGTFSIQKKITVDKVVLYKNVI